MTNVFVSDPHPVISAQALDNKRLLRMCLEAYDALCGALATHRYGPRGEIPPHDYLPHRPAPQFRRHNVIRWTGADGLHYRWVLAHAAALQSEAHYRSGKTTNCAMYDRCHAYCAEHVDEIPSHYPAGTTHREIEFYGAFNWNEFRWTYSYPHRGRLALPDHVNLFDRYRLSLLHKWQWTDVRPTLFGARGAPWWAADELFVHWLGSIFGPRVHDNVELRPHSVRQSAGFQGRLQRRVALPPAVALVQTGPLADALVDGQLTLSTAPATAERPAGSAIFADGSTHRLVLSRVWDTQLPPLVVCMLNPSTADAYANDPTVTRVETIARRLHARGRCGGYVVLNWASVRATDPDDMHAHPAPVHALNTPAIETTLAWVRQTWCVRPTVLVAWGGGVHPVDRDGNSTRRLLQVLRRWRSRVVCLGTTARGEPRHPLYLANAVRLRPYVQSNTSTPRRTPSTSRRRLHRRPSSTA